MLYFLLVLIAVGVLLASEDGKALLDSIGKIALIGGLLYLGFWAVVIAIGLLSDSGIRDATIAIVGYPLLAFVVIAGMVALYQKHKKGELGGLFKKHKFTFIFWGIWFVLLIFFGIVYPFFKDNSSSSPSVQNPSATAGTATGGFGNQPTADATATSSIISTLISVLPTSIGQCTLTTVSNIGTRLKDGTTGQDIAGSGSWIAYSDGGSQVSYDTIQGIEDSIIGDQVKLCLVSIPTNCPVGDDRGKVYSATNLRTGESWEASATSHSCGGA